jgi:hypothetical protein
LKDLRRTIELCCNDNVKFTKEICVNARLDFRWKQPCSHFKNITSIDDRSSWTDEGSISTEDGNASIDEGNITADEGMTSTEVCLPIFFSSMEWGEKSPAGGPFPFLF